MMVVPCTVSVAIFVYLVASGESGRMRFFDVACFLFAPIILMIGWLDLCEPFRRLIRPVKWIGDSTYSTYLWHFPIQVAILIAFSWFEWSRGFFDHPAVLIIRIVGMVLLAHLSFRRIERPLQNYIKSKFHEIASQEPRP